MPTATEMTASGAELLRLAKSLQGGKQAEVLDVLQRQLRQHTLDAEALERIGRIIRKALQASAGEVSPMQVMVLGQLTTTWLTPVLTAVACQHGALAMVNEGGYDTILQDLAALQDQNQRPNVVVLLPWSQRLLSGSSTPAELIEAELRFWQRAWDVAAGRLGARILQVGYDWVTPGPLGYALASQPEGPISLTSEMNRALRERLPTGSYFLDLGLVAGTMGRSSFYDMRRYFWTKQPFGEEAVVHLAEHIWAGVRALSSGPKKVLVLDLDNTLWGGIVGETGPHGIAIGDSPDGEAFRGFQHYLKGLAERGVVLAIASKNNEPDALEVFEKNPDMILRLDNFGAYEINWDPKGSTIARLAKTLNLGLDSFVFFDDNPAEREQVRRTLPDVEVVEVPEDPAEYVRALQKGLYFETTGLTEEDRKRTGQYAIERQRRKLVESAESLDDYLVSLEMRGDVRAIDEADLARVVQLLAKTNQFNLTTRRHGRETLVSTLFTPGSIGVTLRLEDRFGDHGLVAVMIVVPATEALSADARIDTWLMSCRVIGRTAEQFLFGRVLERCRALGYKRLIGEYIPTKKNALVAQLYPSLAFQRVENDREDGTSFLFTFDVEGTEPPVAFINDVSSAEFAAAAIVGTNGR
jgi:FkbH-like protein